MDHQFWHERWQRKEIGFHLSEVNPLLIRYWPTLQLPSGGRVLVPLCGKSHDLLWLRQQGYRVVGVELSPLAVEEFFKSAGLTPSVSERGGLQHWQAEGIEIYCGDLFALQTETVGHMDAFYDRAALVALPPKMRVEYAQQLIALAGRVPGLLISFDYDQSLVAGPPFSVPPAEQEQLYRDAFRLQQLAVKRSSDVPPKFRQQGIDHFNERVIQLIPH